MQVAINKCFLLNPEKKIGVDSFCHFREKRRTHTLIPKKTSPSRKLGYNNQLITMLLDHF